MVFPSLRNLTSDICFSTPELMGNGTLGHEKTIGNILNTEFFHRKYVQDTDPGRITENLEQVGAGKTVYHH